METHNTSPSDNASELPPPLPKRNSHSTKNPSYANGKIPVDTVFANEDITSNVNKINKTRKTQEPNGHRKKSLKMSKSASAPCGGTIIENSVYVDSSVPPPLPPRAPLSASRSSDPDAVNSLNKQMSYPLVATCATLVNNYVSNM